MSEPILTTENVVETDTKDLAAAPEKLQLTRKQIGEIRRRYITVVHGTVRACEHKFDPTRPPKNNCEYCWEAYFVTATDTAAIHDDLMKGGKKRLQAVYGDVFTKAFGKFLTNQMSMENNDNESTGPSASQSNDQPTHSDQCDCGVGGEVPSGSTGSVPSGGA